MFGRFLMGLFGLYGFELIGFRKVGWEEVGEWGFMGDSRRFMVIGGVLEDLVGREVVY